MPMLPYIRAGTEAAPGHGHRARHRAWLAGPRGLGDAPGRVSLASDTLIGVVRTGAVTRHQALPGPAREFSFLAATGSLVLWLLRLTVAPRSTLGGFRAG